MSRRFRFWSRIFLPLLLVGALGGLGILTFVLSRYPWAMITSDYGNAKGLRFMAPWPLSPLQDELHAKKKKRLPKTEMERIYQLDLRRMDYINIPIFDVAMSPTVKHVAFDPSSRQLGFSEYPWPWLETSRKLGIGGGPQNVSYVLIPQGRGLALAEGILMAPGEELEFSFPLAKLKRYFRVFVMPLNTGTLKINLGPYAWAHTFTDADVNKVQFISVPINDAASTQMKILAASSKLFLMSAKVTQSEMSGRMPVQVAPESPFWALNPTFARAPQEVDEGYVDETKIDENAAASETPKPDETAKPDETPTPAPAVAEATEPPEPAPAEAQTRSEELDSLNLAGNQQIPSLSGQTVALGYNLMVVHLDAIEADKLRDDKLLEKLAPRIAELKGESLVFDDTLALPETDQRAFRQVVAGERLPHFVRESSRLLRHELERRGSFNLYRHLRNFGYHVVGVAPASVLGVSPELAWVKDTGAFGRRWLDSNDWNHARRRVKIDRDAQPLKGLEAVFAGKEQTVPPPMVTSDYTAVSRYFEWVARDNRSFPDWQANELFLPDDRENYGATVVDYLQGWTGLNRQVRFFAHLWLSAELTHDLPFAKDLLHVALARKVSGLSDELLHGHLAEIARLDRVVGQTIDLLKVRRLAHRTVLAVIVPDVKREGKPRTATVFLKIPGVLPRKTSGLRLGLDDLVASSLAAIGVPLQTIPEEGGFSLPGRNLESLFSPPRPAVAAPTPEASEASLASEAPSDTPSPEPVVPDKRAVTAFHVALRPGAKGCTPVVWRAVGPVFGIESSHPVLELDASGRELTFFPCAIDAPLVTVRWYQALEPRPAASETTEARLRREAGGSFVFSKPNLNSDKDLPRFFLGGKALRFAHPFLSIVNPSSEEVERVLVDDEIPEGMSPGLAFEKLRLASLSSDKSLDSPERVAALLLWRTRTAR